ncbi:MAG: TIGR02281 family clan AA aspartic protease [Myxococcota bacterium]|nr:TIGR02281 family clan AA aspartic protease [Myxococcota bacterium]
MAARGRAGIALLASLLIGPPAGAEIYRWTDAQGRVHFTEDLGQVPADQRTAATEAAQRRSRAPSRLQTYERPDPPARRARPYAGSRVLRVPFVKRGGAMLVQVRINDRVTAPFLVDTGASDVAIPASVAARAGIRVGPDAPRAVYQTANGLVSKPLVTLDSVEVGEARLEDVRGSVSDSMEVGLLGGTFFNNFTLQIDPASSVLTLVRNDRVRRGLSERQWRDRFRELRGKLARVRRYLEENRLARQDRVAQLETARDRLARELEALEREADRASVPHGWRE